MFFQSSPLLQPLSLAASVRTRRSSSYDRNGGNIDFRRIPAGESLTLLETAGAGMVTHLWFALSHIDPNYLRKLVLRAWWDGEDEPSILCPLGDFFGVGHAVTAPYQSLLMNMVRGTGLRGESTGMNSYLPMPFTSGARIDVLNESPAACMACYYHVDWQEMAPADTEPYGTLHAGWTRRNPTPPVEQDTIGGWEFGRACLNCSDRDNFPVADIRGTGRFLGMNLSIDNIDPKFRGYNISDFGEGDEMIFIDDETWPPSLHGTGTEDYFTDAWGMMPRAGYYAGVTYTQSATEESRRQKGTCFRFHVLDPIYFRHSLRFSIEHGHANHQANDYAATAYWYQQEAHQPLTLPPVEARLPIPDGGDPDPAEELRMVDILGTVLDQFYRIFMYGPRAQVTALSGPAVEHTVGKIFGLRERFLKGEVDAGALDEAIAPEREALSRVVADYSSRDR